MQAREIMSQPVISIRDAESIDSLCRLLSQHRISGVPVLGENEELIGIVTEADVLQKTSEATVAQIMTRAVLSVSESTPLEEVASILATHAIKRVPVLKDGRLTGIVSRADIVRAVALGEPLHRNTPLFDL